MDKKKTIILVEDNPADVALVRIAFEELSTPLELLHFYNGMDLMSHLQIAEIHHITLIILDLNMPKMGGIEVLQAFQKCEHLKRIPVLVWSSSIHREDITTCYNLGVNAYINKPLDIDYFYKMITSIANFWLDLNQFVDFSSAKNKM